MWHLFILVVIFGSVFCSQGINREANVGDDVRLKCILTNTTEQSKFIYWVGDGSVLFRWNLQEGSPINTTMHTLEVSHEPVSILTLNNVSLANEGIYTALVVSNNYRNECRINLTVNVPPERLILVDGMDNGSLHKQGTLTMLTVGEGENGTLICKTNGSVKPPVYLEWNVSVGIIFYDDLQDNKNVVHDGRLSVSTRTMVFTPLYNGTEELLVVCRVANTSFSNVTTSAIIRKEGTIPTSNPLVTTSEGNNPSSTSDGEVKGTSPQSKHLATTSEESNSSPATDEEAKGNRKTNLTAILIGGCSGLVVLLICIVGGFIFYRKKRAVRNSRKTEFIRNAIRSSPPQDRRRTLPPTPPGHPPLPDRSTSLLQRQMPSAPHDIPMRSLVPVSEDTVRGSGEGLVKSRMNEESDIETDYDLLNHGSPWAVPHVYRETTNGLQIYDSDADDSDYDLLNTCHLTASATVPHVYRETNTGLAEYAVVSKPGDENKGQSLVSHSKAVKIPHKVEAEYAVVDKSEKRNNKRR